MSLPHIDAVERPVLVPAATRLGAVHIAVTDGERSLKVWRDLLGLRVIRRDEAEIGLGVGQQELVVLRPGAKRPVVKRASGLYHVAIHVPTRADLARVIGRLFASRYPNSPTDHLATETTYLWDLDGNGIEVTFETPERGQFAIIDGQPVAIDPAGGLHSGRDPVDLDSLFAELAPGESLSAPLPDGSRVGHVHLHVADLDAAMRFYRDLIGFQEQMLVAQFQMGDVTLPNYVPHIIAFNTWAGVGVSPAPADASGLRFFTIRLPDAAALEQVIARLDTAGVNTERTADGVFTHDPSQNRVLLVADA